MEPFKEVKVAKRKGPLFRHRCGRNREKPDWGVGKRIVRGAKHKNGNGKDVKGKNKH